LFKLSCRLLLNIKKPTKINRVPERLADVCIEDIVYSYDNVTQEESEVVTLRPNCIQPTNISVTFSTYGTYTVFYEGGSDGIKIVLVANWDWLNENQTEILYVPSNEDDEESTTVISSITDDSLILSETSDGEVTDFCVVCTIKFNTN